MKFKQVERFDRLYYMRQELGAGAFGTVHLGEHQKTGVPCAIKIIKKQSLQQHQIYEELNRQDGFAFLVVSSWAFVALCLLAIAFPEPHQAFNRIASK